VSLAKFRKVSKGYTKPKGSSNGDEKEESNSLPKEN
jgi:hypothetical protein